MKKTDKFIYGIAAVKFGEILIGYIEKGDRKSTRLNSSHQD